MVSENTSVLNGSLGEAIVCSGQGVAVGVDDQCWRVQQDVDRVQPAGLSGQSSRRTSRHAVRSVVPKACLKSRQATTCEGLSINLARKAVVMTNPPWGVPIPNCRFRRKTSKSDLACLRRRWLRSLGQNIPIRRGLRTPGFANLAIPRRGGRLFGVVVWTRPGSLLGVSPASSAAATARRLHCFNISVRSVMSSEDNCTPASPGGCSCSLGTALSWAAFSSELANYFSAWAVFFFYLLTPQR